MKELLRYIALFLRRLFEGSLVVVLAKYWKLAVFIFILVLSYMTIHFRVIDSSKEIRTNAQELKQLKIRHTTLCSILQDKCTREEVERGLAALQSELHQPNNPPVTVRIEKR